MSSKVTILATLFAATLVTLMSLPLASADTVERDVGNLVLSNGPTCTATSQDSGNMLYADVNDTVQWYVDVTGSSDVSGTLHYWFNLTVSKGLQKEYVWSDDKYDNITYVFPAPPFTEELRISWEPEDEEWYYIEWYSSMWFDPLLPGPSCDDTMGGGHTLNTFP